MPAIASLPLLKFRCVVFYMTPAGHYKQCVTYARAKAADIAADIAAERVRHDKRRQIAAVTFIKAEQL